MPEKSIPVFLSEHEIALLAASLNEALEAVEDWEFHTRTGAYPAEARELHARLKTILENLNRSE